MNQEQPEHVCIKCVCTVRKRKLKKWAKASGIPVEYAWTVARKHRRWKIHKMFGENRFDMSGLRKRLDAHAAMEAGDAAI